MPQVHRFSKIVAALLIAILIAGGCIVLYVYFIAGGSVSETIRNWFPESGTAPQSETITVTPEVEEGERVPLPEETLFQISRNPVAGASFKMGTSTVLFVERETGNIHSFSFETREKARLTNATLPRLQEALFSASGSRVALRYLGEDLATIETFIATVPLSPSLDSGELEGVYLPRNITSMDSGPTGDEFLYVVPRSSGVAGFITTLSAAAPDTQVWSSPLSEWRSQWLTPTTMTLETLPSGETPGYSYLLNTNSNIRERMLGDIRGLTTNVAPDLSRALYSQSREGWLTLSVVDLKTGEPSELPLYTLPEKCVWEHTTKTTVICAVPGEVAAGVYPDMWYQGKVFLSDSLWRIDTETSEITLLAYLPEEAAGSVDVTGLRISNDDRLLMFTNKRDGSLWGLLLYKLTEENL